MYTCNSGCDASNARTDTYLPRLHLSRAHLVDEDTQRARGRAILSPQNLCACEWAEAVVRRPGSRVAAGRTASSSEPVADTSGVKFVATLKRCVGPHRASRQIPQTVSSI